MSIICLTIGLLLIDVDVKWLLSVVYLLMRIIASFLRYTGYLTFIKDPQSKKDGNTIKYLNYSHFIANFNSFTVTESSII